MGRKFWNFRAAKEKAGEPKAGELMLYGPIGADDGLGWLFDEMTPKQFKADLDALGDIAELRVFVNSPGGDVFAGQAIHSILQRHPAQIIVHVDGIAASIASIVVMAGDRVIMPRNAMMMVHNPYTMAMGDSEEFRKQADVLDRVRESMLAAYETKTRMSRDELLPLLDAETWMTAEEAVEMGFADEIEEAMPVAASLVRPGVLAIGGQIVDMSRYRNPPSWPLAGGRADHTQQTYANHAASVLAALREFEGRTLERLASRERASRTLSDADVERWEAIQETAHRVLDRVAGAPPAAPAADDEQDRATRLFTEFQALRARLAVS